MSLPFSIYLQPPSLLVQPIYSGLNLVSLVRNGTWGQVIQTNPETLPFDVGNVIFYEQEGLPLIRSNDNNQVYNIVNENKVLFIEGSITPP